MEMGRHGRNRVVPQFEIWGLTTGAESWHTETCSMIGMLELGAILVE